VPGLDVDGRVVDVGGPTGHRPDEAGDARQTILRLRAEMEEALAEANAAVAQVERARVKLRAASAHTATLLADMEGLVRRMTMAPPEAMTLSIAQAAAYMGIHENTLRSRLKRDDLLYRWLVDEQEGQNARVWTARWWNWMVYGAGPVAPVPVERPEPMPFPVMGVVQEDGRVRALARLDRAAGERIK